LSRRTVVVILVALAFLAIATTIRSGWLYLVASVLLASVPIELFGAWSSVRRIVLKRECPPEVFEGEQFTVRVEIRNKGRLRSNLVTVSDHQFVRPKRGRMFQEMALRRAAFKAFMSEVDWAEVEAAAARMEAREATVVAESIPPGSSVEINYSLTAPRRGIHEQAEMLVGSGGLLGGASVARHIILPSRLVVFPRVTPLDNFPFDPTTSVAPSETYEWGRKGIGQDYYGVREYVRGDSLRHIHWRTSARHGQLIVKEYQQDYRPSAGMAVVLVEPELGDEDTNSMEDGLRATASILDYYASMGNAPRLVLPRDSGFEVSEETGLNDNLTALAGYMPPRGYDGGGYEPGRSEYLARALEMARSAIGPGRTLTVVTNLPHGDAIGALRFAGGSETLSMVLVVDESYGGEWTEEMTRRIATELANDGFGRVSNLYLLVKGRAIAACLSEPLSISAA
jgi:uncharacterized protein (DUF58 family)